MDKRQEAKGRAAFARIWAIVGCFKNSHSATVCNSTSSLPTAWVAWVKGPEKYPPAFYMRFAHRASSCAFPSAGRPHRHTGFHHNLLWRRSEKRAHPDSRLFQIPDWRAENGDSVVHPPSRFYPFGTSQPSHASGRTRVKSSQSVALLSSSVKTYARTSVKPVSPIKCPYTACPSRIAAKRNAVSGPVDQLALPGKQKSFFKSAVSPFV